MSLPSNSKRKIFDGRYEILSIVGRGADSVVYHGRHITGAVQEVAIKVLINRDGTTTLTDKLRREALTLVSCRHRYVVRLDDFHSIQDLCYLSMEYAEKGDLLKYISSLPDKRLPPDQVAVFLKQSLEAIDFVHATGVIHRDLKPENILVLNEKEIRLADFGLALLPGDEIKLEELRHAVGSFDYLAPEVLDGIRYDTSSDLYSLGVCFYEAAAGRHPFSHAPIAEQRDARQDARVVPLSQAAPHLPPHVAAVISTLMRFSSNDRFYSASEALRALGNPDYRASNQALDLAPAVPVDSPAPMAASATRQVSSSSAALSPSADDSSVSQVATVQVHQSIPALQSTPAVSSQPSHQSSVQQTPANNDEVSTRQSTPTEKIDLERIKAIIARDSQRRSNSTGSFDSASTSNADPISANQATSSPASNSPALAPIANAVQHKRGASRQKSQSTFGATGLPLFSKALARFIGVALTFALLTIGSLYGYHALTGSTAKAEKNTQSADIPVEVAADTDSAPQVAEQEADDASPAPLLRDLAQGTYSGMIQGLFPGRYVPMALIADPQQHRVTLLLGLEGWLPATVSLDPEVTPETEGPTFRSNGLILKFNQESSSSAITGTVIDVVTGEAGTWKLSGKG
jgi:serine/threonine protein kinase